MATTTMKAQNFQATPLIDVKLKEVPGVGPKLLEKLEEANIDTAEKLMGHFLVMGRDTDRFKTWLEDVCEIRGQDGAKVVEPLAEKADKLVKV
mmetsp:Transcript_16984/g.37954  ORF Transcript_16984/g.37954 Transcript_16984/m.37954 type:complete len:93 (-) Transcript_16984:70-348(-)